MAGTRGRLVRGLPTPATLFRDLHNSRHYAQHHRLQVAVPPKACDSIPPSAFLSFSPIHPPSIVGEASSVVNAGTVRRGLDSFQRILVPAVTLYRNKISLLEQTAGGSSQRGCALAAPNLWREGSMHRQRKTLKKAEAGGAVCQPLLESYRFYSY